MTTRLGFEMDGWLESHQLYGFFHTRFDGRDKGLVETPGFSGRHLIANTVIFSAIYILDYVEISFDADTATQGSPVREDVE